MLRGWAQTEGVANDPERLRIAQRNIQIEILKCLYNDAGELGGYLSRMALMPKGVNSEILLAALDLPSSAAGKVDDLLGRLRPLSFIKEFKARPDDSAAGNGRVFLHDEMYQLLTWRDLIPNIRYDEKTVARRLVAYFGHQIEDMERTRDRLTGQERTNLRSRVEQLQLERMYYWLIADPCEGYTIIPRSRKPGH